MAEYEVKIQLKGIKMKRKRKIKIRKQMDP
jgi:hypothetical protein